MFLVVWLRASVFGLLAKNVGGLLLLAGLLDKVGLSVPPWSVLRYREPSGDRGVLPFTRKWLSTAIGNLFLKLGRYVVERVLAGTQQVVDRLLPVGPPGVAVAKAAPSALARSARQRRRLAGGGRRPPAPPRLVRRARLLLALAAGHSPPQVAKQLGILRQTVYT